ncbi:MAG: hypothetical protein HDR04_09910 [Lachnospiraceae bacterium]|nr:hypothetical protein [Lachnospiraceae bacterium]
MLQKIVSKKWVWCGILAVELLILAALGFIYSRREKVELNFAQEDFVDNTGAEAFYIDKSYGTQYVATPDFTLPKGMYTLEAWYEYAGDVRLEVCYHDSWFDSDIGGKIFIKESGNIQCDFRVKYNDRPLHIQGRLSGDSGEQDYLLLRGIRITTATVDTRNFMFRIAILFMVLDLILIIYALRDRLFADAEVKNQYKLLFLLICLSSLPLTVNYLFSNAQDLGFHLIRIEGIKDGWMNGVFPVKIPTNWMEGHGYAVSVFYGDLLLYIPAFLRIFGVSILGAYNFYVFMINVLTVVISYYCFSRMSNRHNGLVCAAIYSLNIFRLYDVYSRAAVGEYTAMAFMPLVLYGLWKVYKLPEESTEHGRSWITITAGCTGIFLSHMISTEMVALFVILAVVILWRKTIRKKTFVVLIKTLGATVLLNLWFLLPFLDYMMSGTYAINNLDRYVPYRMEEKGGYIVQLFMTDYVAMGSSGAISSRGAASSMPHTAGNAVMFILIGWFLFCMGQKGRDKREKREEYLAVFLSVLSIFMTRYMFPYTWLVDKIPVLTFPVHGLQFQWRFFAVAVVVVLWLLCIVMQKNWIDRKKKIFFGGLLVFLSVSQGITFISKLMNEATVYHIYQEGGIDTWDIGFAEYIPVEDAEGFSVETYTNGYREELVYDPGYVSVEEWHREKGTLVIHAQNMSDESSQIEVPIILYKGYRAVTDSGEQLQISPGNFYRIVVSVPAGYSGGIRIGFHEPWYWRVCEAISVVTLFGIIFYMINGRKQKTKDSKKMLISK